MIVLEGCDNAGKSTLGKRLSEDLGIGYAHTSKPGRTVQEMDRMILQMINCPDLMVYDRIPIISEQVYGPHVRGENKYEGEHGIDVMATVLKAEPMFIFCRPPARTMISMELQQKEHETKGHIDAVRKRMIDIIHAYDDHFLSLMPYYRFITIYNWKNYDSILADCKSYIMKKKGI